MHEAVLDESCSHFGCLTDELRQQSKKSAPMGVQRIIAILCYSFHLVLLPNRPSTRLLSADHFSGSGRPRGCSPPQSRRCHRAVATLSPRRSTRRPPPRPRRERGGRGGRAFPSPSLPCSPPQPPLLPGFCPLAVRGRYSDGKGCARAPHCQCAPVRRSPPPLPPLPLCHWTRAHGGGAVAGRVPCQPAPRRPFRRYGGAGNRGGCHR